MFLFIISIAMLYHIGILWYIPIDRHTKKMYNHWRNPRTLYGQFEKENEK